MAIAMGGGPAMAAVPLVLKFLEEQTLSRSRDDNARRRAEDRRGSSNIAHSRQAATRRRLAGEYVGPMHAEFPGCAFFPGATEAVEAGRYTYIVETEVPQE